MKEFDLNDKLDLPININTKYIKGFYIIFAPQYPNWIVLDEDEYKFFNYLIGNSIKDSMLMLRDLDHYKEGYVLSIANNVLYKIEYSQFYINTEIQKEVEMREIIKSIHINITNDCNLRCKHCYMSAGLIEKQELDKGRLIPFIKEITKLNGCTDVIISGGEPLLYKDIFEVILTCKELGHNVILFTNGILINKSNIDFISSNVDEIQISMEGISRKFYEMIRGYGNYAHLISTLKLLRERNVPITLAVTVLDDVLNDVTDYIIPFLNELDFRYINVKINDEIELKGNMLSYKNVYTINEQDKKIAVIDIIKKLVDNGYSVIKSKERNTHFSNCGIGTSVNINFDGKIYPCSEFGCDYFDIDTPPAYIIDQFNIINKTSSIEFMDACIKCEIKYICNGGCRIKNFLEKGSYINPSCSEVHKEKKYCDLLIDYFIGE